jgi:hypothetical protein
VARGAHFTSGFYIKSYYNVTQKFLIKWKRKILIITFSSYTYTLQRAWEGRGMARTVNSGRDLRVIIPIKKIPPTVHSSIAIPLPSQALL